MKVKRMIRKDRYSGDSNCPALYEVDGGFVVVGERTDAETRAQLDAGVGKGEYAVFVPANVLAEIAAAL